MSNFKNLKSELNNALLLYLCECHNAGDIKSLDQLGLNHELRDLLEDATISEILHLSRIPSHFASIQIDNNLLRSLFTHVRKESRNRKSLNKLIVAGAPLKLLKELVGINAAEFSSLRKSLNVKTLGRTQDPAPEEEMLIYEHWKSFNMKSNLTADEWIAFAERSKLPIKTIFKVISEGNEYGKAN